MSIRTLRLRARRRIGRRKTPAHSPFASVNIETARRVAKDAGTVGRAATAMVQLIEKQNREQRDRLIVDILTALGFKRR